jgi:hypothetical protein
VQPAPLAAALDIGFRPSAGKPRRQGAVRERTGGRVEIRMLGGCVIRMRRTDSRETRSLSHSRSFSVRWQSLSPA